MATLTIRSVPDEIKVALKERAARNDRSMEAEVREIIADTVAPRTRSFGQALLEAGAEIRALGGLELDDVRDHTPLTPIDFS